MSWSLLKPDLLTATHALAGPYVWVGAGTWGAWVGGQAWEQGRMAGEDGSAVPPKTPSSLPALSSTVSRHGNTDAQQQVHGARHMVDVDQSVCLRGSRSGRAKALLPLPRTPPSLSANYHN